MLYLVWVLLILSLDCMAEEQPSLMLSQTEQQALQQALHLVPTLKETQENQSNSAPQDSLLNLSAILYFDDKKWTIWLNGQAINNKQTYPGLLLKKVNSHTITFTTHEDPKTEITLQLNQSYSFIEKRVFDGYK